MICALCSCCLVGGKGLSRKSPGLARWLCHFEVSGVRPSSTLLLLVQRGWTIHLQHGRPTQTRYCIIIPPYPAEFEPCVLYYRHHIRLI